MKKKTILGMCIVIIICILAILAPYLIKTDPNEINLSNRLLEPSKNYVLGTDNLGRDIFARTVWGARITVLVATIVLGISLVVGVTIGIISGYVGGILDDLLSSIIDIVLSFPDMILILAIAGMLGPSLLNTIICMTFVSWVTYARTTRNIVKDIKNKEFVKASIICGSSHLYIIRKHILPNIYGPIIVLAATSIGFIVLKIASLSFLGVGIQPPAAEWGAMLNEGKGYIQTAPWMMIGPGLALMSLVAGCNLIGDGLAER